MILKGKNYDENINNIVLKHHHHHKQDNCTSADLPNGTKKFVHKLQYQQYTFSTYVNNMKCNHNKNYTQKTHCY